MSDPAGTAGRRGGRHRHEGPARRRPDRAHLGAAGFGRSHDLRRLIAALDQAAARRIARTNSWPLDHVMPGLSRLADRGLLWIGLAAALWATGDRQVRRAAWRGLGSMAAAFVTGAAIEMPSLAAPGIALASAVGASRIATGVHYPSDVLAGTAIEAAAGLATLWWWPRRPGRAWR